VKCYWAPESGAPLVPAKIVRRAPSPHDVIIKIVYAGICHSDIHSARSEWEEAWGAPHFPLVPGHEIAGVVMKVGSKVTRFQIGQKVGVGCMVDSCRACSNCRLGDEQYCIGGGSVLTYAGQFKYPHCAEYNEQGGNHTAGGYSEMIVVDENYVISIPDNLDFSCVAPLLCAGITTYSPLIHFGLKPNQRLAVAGLGGLGHMAVKFGVAFDAHVTVLSRGTNKKESSLNHLKANGYVDVTNPAEMAAAYSSFDMIINTIATDFDVAAYLNLLKTNGNMCMVGVPSKKQTFFLQALTPQRRMLSASGIGGIRETQEMMDFCGRHNITCDCELIKADQINEAYERTLKGDVKYRFVIDISTL
jgi:uncharacterized zinc-type alcohol dehydrogenase-like protein